MHAGSLDDSFLLTRCVGSRKWLEIDLLEGKSWRAVDGQEKVLGYF